MDKKKYFTPEEANQTLPLVKPIVTDILDTGQKIRSLVAYLKDEAETNQNVENLINQLNNYFQELEDLGCYFKDWSFGIGLVDFPSIIEDKEVLLCWRSDEENLQFYHRHNDGYSGRKPIPSEYLNGGNGRLTDIATIQ